MTPMPTRVLILSASYGSGHAEAARSLATAFEARGVEPAVVDHFRELVHPVFEGRKPLHAVGTQDKRQGLNAFPRGAVICVSCGDIGKRADHPKGTECITARNVLLWRAVVDRRAK